MNSPDAFRYDDAAYVFGALDEPDRMAFEAHLETCADCRAGVAAARATTDLLAGISVDEVEEPTPMPDTLLPGLLRRAQRERTRRRWLTGSLAGLAAACAVTLTVLLWPSSSTGSGPAPEAFTKLRPEPVSATAQLVARAWGTEIDLQCRYGTNVEYDLPYNLVVVDKDGKPHQAGSWTLAPGHEITFTGGTWVQLTNITQLQITRADGTPVLSLDT